MFSFRLEHDNFEETFEQKIFKDYRFYLLMMWSIYILVFCFSVGNSMGFDVF